MGHDSFKPTNQDEPTTEINPKKIGADEPAEEVSTDEASITNVAAKASLASNQTVGSGTVTQVNLGLNDLEDSDVVSVDLSNDRLRIETGGKYLLFGQARINGSANWSNGDRQFMQIEEAGSSVVSSQLIQPGANTFVVVRASTIIQVADGDTPRNIMYSVFHNSGSDETLDSGAKVTFLAAGRVG